MTTNLKIENTPGWVKNPTNKAILNSDITALQEYKLKKQKNIKINTIESEVDDIKSQIKDLNHDIKEIKDILLQFIQNKNEK
jgi:hypothetical protein